MTTAYQAEQQTKKGILTLTKDGILELSGVFQVETVYDDLQTFQLEAGVTPAQPLPNVTAKSIVLINDPSNSSGQTIYIGGQGVTITSGIPLVVGATLTVPISNLNKLYAVVASSTAILDIMVLN